MTLPADPVVSALRDPRSLTRLSAAEWDRLVRAGRRADLLSRIACQVQRLGIVDRMPAAPWLHFEAARLLALAQHEGVRREVGHIREALDGLQVPIILLKGAAYLMADLPPAEGRVFSDIDILVPKQRIAEVEACLMLRGWATTHQSDYDQKYYRTWMHELPPMQHVRRATVLDVHHALLPTTARRRPDTAKLLEAARSLDESGDLKVLAPTDLVLHSMAHLFHNEEFNHGLRDLSDLDLLLRHFGSDDGFWHRLTARAEALDLSRALHYGLRYAHRILDTPVPADVLAEAQAKAAPPSPLSWVMDGLWTRVLRTPHPLVADSWTGASQFALYVRAHWLRMPPLLLARHLFIKATTRSRPTVSP